jgi:CheY-like chemotaxis protein/HPt (histidine-containing phosphotransfer) domain-containing protein
MGGTIDASSSLGQGSRFVISIPCQVVPSTAEAAPTLDQHSGQQPQSVLVVEDNAVNRQVVQGLLLNMGIESTAVGNGAEALRALGSAHDFDFVLMDMQMPVLDGLSATRELRRMGATLPIVGLTANAFESDRRSCLDAGMDDFIAKPITRRKLLDAFRSATPSSTPRSTGSHQRAAMIEEFGRPAYDELVAAMIEDGRRLVQDASASRGDDTPVLALHSLKGMARTLGFAALGERAERAERAARQGAPVEYAELRLAIDEIEHGAAIDAATPFLAHLPAVAG